MPDTNPPAPTQRTRISPKWIVKMSIFMLALLVFGAWGLYDAAVVYRRRGMQAAEVAEYRFLDALKDKNKGRLTNETASLADPAGEMRRLHDADRQGNITPVDRAELDWLQQLKYVGELRPENTRLPRQDYFAGGVSKGAEVPDAMNRWQALKGAPSASPLSAFDIPVQWLICVVGLGWGLYLAGLMLSVRGRTYRWTPDELRLHLPGGDSFVPADIDEIDKRKWHKFFVSMKIRATHAKLAGKSIELDLLRYVPLEDWVLQMERAAFPEEHAGSAGQATATPAT